MNRRPVATGLIVALVSLFVAVLVALLSTPTVVWLDIGSPNDQEYIKSASVSETNYLGTYRWAFDQTQVQIPVPSAGEYRVEFGMFTIQPEDRLLHATCGENTRTVSLADRAGYFTVSLSCATANGQITIDLESDPVRIAGDGRPLGVGLVSVNLQPRDPATLVLYYVQVAITVFATLVGLYICADALGWRRGRFILPGVAAYSLLVIAIFGQGLFIAGVAGPGGLLLLAGSLTTAALAAGRRKAALLIALLTVPLLLLIPPPKLELLLAAHWTANDAWATLLLPWVAAATLILAAVIGTQRAVWLAATGTLAGLLSLTLPAISRSFHFSVEIAAPDWQDLGSPGGVVYLLTVLGTVAVAYWAVRSRPEHPVLGLTAVTAFAVVSLVVWRVGVMDLNGDEPHYYVMARSLGVDQDLELLNNYHEPDYLDATISPDGNIAMSRQSDADRYSAIAAPGEQTWYLVPPGWQSDPGTAGLYLSGGEPPQVTAPGGTKEWMMPLDAADELVMVIPSRCEIDELWVGIPDGQPRQITVAVLNLDGSVAWQTNLATADDLAGVPLDTAAGVCQSPESTTIRFSATGGPVIAQALDTLNGLQVIPARKESDFVILAGTPRDRYASRASWMRVGVFNPEDAEILITIRLMSSSNLTIRETVIGLPAGQTRVEIFPTSSVDAVHISATGRFIASGNAGLLGHRYTLPLARALSRWEVPVAGAAGRDAGVWLSLVNPRRTPGQVVIQSGEDVIEEDVCALCARTILLESADADRAVVVTTEEVNQIWVGAVEYEERTESLHFDVGLPLITAIPAAIGPVWAVFSITTLLAVLMAPGMFILLRRAGCSDDIATAGALLSVLLLPMSAYVVRLYTEPVAASVLVWALVFWDLGRRRVWVNVFVLAIAATLPLLHGRLTPIAVGLVVLVVVSLASGRLRLEWSRRFIGQLALVFGLVTGIAFLAAFLSPFAVSLNVRGGLDYFGFAWVPINTAGMLLDRGSGLLPFAPWILLGIAAPRPLASVQRAALLLVVVNAIVIALRVGGWQTWGAPGRYLLPVVPLLLLFAVPGAVRLWESYRGRVAVILALGWSLLAIFLLHWVPLSGYTYDGIYLIDELFAAMRLPSPWKVFPAIAPEAGPVWTGLLGLLILIILGVVVGSITVPLLRSGSRSPEMPPEHTSN